MLLQIFQSVSFYYFLQIKPGLDNKGGGGEGERKVLLQRLQTVSGYYLLQVKQGSCGLKTNSRNMSLLQRNNETERIAGMKEYKMTREKKQLRR